MKGKIYLIENQDNMLLGLFGFFKIKLCAKMMFSLLLRLQKLNCFVPGCTGWLHQMGLIVVTIKLFSLVLQHSLLHHNPLEAFQ